MLIAELRMGTQATGSTSQSWGFGCVAHREVDRECVVGVEPGGRPLRVHQPGQRPQHQPSQLVGAASGAPVDGGSAAVLSTLDSDAALNAAMGAPRGNDFLSALLGAGRWWRGGPARVCVCGGVRALLGPARPTARGRSRPAPRRSSLSARPGDPTHQPRPVSSHLQPGIFMRVAAVGAVNEASAAGGGS